jgi:hypothetical protein
MRSFGRKGLFYVAATEIYGGDVFLGDDSKYLR